MRTVTEDVPESEIVEAVSFEEPEEALWVPVAGASKEKEEGGAGAGAPVLGPVPSSEPVAGEFATIISMVGGVVP
jgi:hypothetical protein